MLKKILNKLLIPVYIIVGNFRYYCYYTNDFYRFLLRKKIKDSICKIITNIDRECYNGASCKKCGCHVPKQNLGGKPCDCFWISLWNGRMASNIDKDTVSLLFGKTAIDDSTVNKDNVIEHLENLHKEYHQRASKEFETYWDNHYKRLSEDLMYNNSLNKK